MSYELRIYCYGTEFPWAEFGEVLAMVQSSIAGLEVRVDSDGEWCVFTESGGVWIWVTDLGPPHLRSSCAPGARWITHVEANAGSFARWLQFAIPYYVLVLLPDIAVHDCQRCELGLIIDPESYRAWASSAMRWRAMKHDMRERGYLDDEGLPVF